MRCHPTTLTLLLSCTLPASFAAVYEAPSDLPTADEVAILEHMNRFRADPAAEAERILAATDLPGFFWRGVDKAMFASEVKALPKAPPLVFDLNALRSARRHSYYMIHNGLGHVEESGKEGFTGNSFADRMKAAGFTGGPAGENCFAAAGNAWQSHVAFIIDFGEGGPGGMQNGRGHRTNMANPGSTVVGPSAVPNGSALSVTHNFGRVGTRFAGGVVYSDANGNGLFDPGEGRGDIVVRCGKNETRTWPSGGYVLPLDASAPVVSASFGALSASAPVTPKDNVHFSWSIPPQADLDLCDKLVQAVEKIPADQRTTRGLKALVELHERSRSLTLDAERRAKVASLTETVGAELKSQREALLAAIAADDDNQLKEAVKAGRKWRGTAAQPWFDSADLLVKASAGVRGFEAATAKGTTADPAKTKQLAEALRQAQSQAPSDLAQHFAALLRRISG